jgi:hypothetical protein
MGAVQAPNEHVWNVTKLAQATIGSCIDRYTKGHGVTLFEDVGLDKQKEVNEYLTHYAESVVRIVCKAGDMKTNE